MLVHDRLYQHQGLPPGSYRELRDGAWVGRLVPSVEQANGNLARAGSDQRVAGMAADKGYHQTAALSELEVQGIRAYIAERKDRFRRCWTDKPASFKAAVYATRRRMRGAYGKRLQRLRAALAERSIAHAWGGGRGRRTWRRGLQDNQKVHRMRVTVMNLGIAMRACFGIGTPRGLQRASAALLAPLLALPALLVLRPLLWGGQNLRLRLVSVLNPNSRNGALTGLARAPSSTAS